MKKTIFGDNGVMSQGAAARRLNMSIRSIERRIRDGRLDARKDGHRVIVDARSVENYLANLQPVQ